jgi:molybdopterin-guanine dinucleotide biosynthesis protein A
MDNTHSDCLGVVLAGGLSSRMGQDKAQLIHKNTDMLSFSKQLLLDSGINQVVVSGNKHQVTDLLENAGPVGGIYSVIARHQPNALLILPIDLPLMTSKALMQLRLKGELSHKACFFEDHPIPLYLPNNGYLALFLAQVFKHYQPQNIAKARSVKGGPSVKSLIEQVPHLKLKLDTPNILFNTNTPEQWRQATLMGLR